MNSSKGSEKNRVVGPDHSTPPGKYVSGPAWGPAPPGARWYRVRHVGLAALSTHGGARDGGGVSRTWWRPSPTTTTCPCLPQAVRSADAAALVAAHQQAQAAETIVRRLLAHLGAATDAATLDSTALLSCASRWRKANESYCSASSWEQARSNRDQPTLPERARSSAPPGEDRKWPCAPTAVNGSAWRKIRCHTDGHDPRHLSQWRPYTPRSTSEASATPHNSCTSCGPHSTTTTLCSWRCAEPRYARNCTKPIPSTTAAGARRGRVAAGGHGDDSRRA